MWYCNLFNSLTLKNFSKRLQKYCIYTEIFLYNLNIGGSKIWKNFVFTNSYLLFKKIYFILHEINIISIRYIGKIYRIEKYKKKFKLLLHYPGKNYFIWKNIKLKWRRKKKRRFLFWINTNKNVKINLYYNLLKLRIPNTYTKRGLYNNVFTYFSRKRKITNTR